MKNDREQNYNEHARFLADIAFAIINGNKDVLDINGVKEIISLYLLIPYMTEQKLATPGEGYTIPDLEGTFIDQITYAELRNTICHSFVTVEEDKGDGIHGKKLIFDDRIIKNRKNHSKDHHSEAYSISIEVIHRKIVEMASEIMEGKA